MFQRTILLLTLLTLVACSQQNDPDPIAESDNDNYIVVLSSSSIAPQLFDNNKSFNRSSVVRATLATITDQYGLDHPKHIYSVVLDGGAYKLDAEQLEKIARDPRVAYIEKDQRVSVHSVQSNPPSWGLDRLDQPNLPLDQSYHYNTSGAQVNAYVIDTGIKITHQDFQGRAFHGTDIVDGDNDATDCDGHGTHVAGTIGSATYGVAKNVRLYGVRVLDCNGSGSFSDVVAGIEWVAQHHVKPAVANMSLGGGASQAIDDAVSAAVQAGVTFVVAAGNENSNACNSSPARVSSAITVGSVTKSDSRSSFSNYGTCVKVFAPGDDIVSLGITSNSATDTMSGTSMASPHVAGVAALYLAKNPNASPEEVRAAITGNALQGKVSNPGSGSPNLLANTQFLLEPDPTPTPVPTPKPSPSPTPSPTPPSGGINVSNLSGARSSEKNYTLTLPANVAKLTVQISGGTGDADLYLRQGSKPTTSSYSCRPYKSGNSESCSVTSPVAGNWYIMIRGYSSYSGVTLKASY